MGYQCHSTHLSYIVFCVPIFVCTQCLRRKPCYLPGSGHCLTEGMPRALCTKLVVAWLVYNCMCYGADLSSVLHAVQQCVVCARVWYKNSCQRVLHGCGHMCPPAKRRPLSLGARGVQRLAPFIVGQHTPPRTALLSTTCPTASVQTSTTLTTSI
jgi:hypothetical protein